MKPLLLLVLFVSVIAFFASRKKRSVVTGVVLLNSNPLISATVVFRKKSGESISAVTGNDGRIEIRMLYGNYNISVQSAVLKTPSAGLTIAIADDVTAFQIDLKQ